MVGCPVDSLFPYDGLSLLSSYSKSINIVFCLNSSCSFCIAEYLFFCEKVEETDVNVNIWTLTYLEEKDLVLFYINRWQQATKCSRSPIVIPLDVRYPYRDSLLVNDAFLVYNGRIIASIDGNLIVHPL